MTTSSTSRSSAAPDGTSRCRCSAASSSAPATPRRALPSGSQRLLALLALRDRSVTRLMIAGTLWPDSIGAARVGEPAFGADAAARRSARRGRRRRPRPEPRVRCRRRHPRVEARSRTDCSNPNAPHLEPEATAAAVASLSADLLPDWYEDWVLIETAEWRQLRLHALEAMADNLAAEGRWAEAIARRAGRDPRRAAARDVARRADPRVPRRGQPDRGARPVRALPDAAQQRAQPRPDVEHLRPRHADRPPEHRPVAADRRSTRGRAGPRSLTDEHALQLGADLEQDLADPRLGDAELGADLVHLHAGHALRDDPPRAFRHALRRVRERVGRLDLGERRDRLRRSLRAGGRARRRR